ncbi:hypothetical protein [Aestuariibaculum suncheonense]|uniref:Lipoprotein n=1 Tax=Aestuariibaculum suncheonense TaxID=1028745 RepID=A0A8J6Q917_9FLAO|nr:hypothetical protein [Aestuariibaculum suncheonense]MBD0836299.1 hypothetical protein [Aestuariibaculum suncheonense]
MKLAITFTLAFIFFVSCSTSDSREFVAGEVLVGIKSGTDISNTFELINLLQLKVENIRSLTFTSEMPSDNLQYILDELNSKSYTNDGVDWFVTGYIHSETNQITIFPKLFGIDDTEFQNDWLNSMNELKLDEKHNTELNSGVIHFYVPIGQEIKWRNRLTNYSIVDWAELNYIDEIQPLIE